MKGVLSNNIVRWLSIAAILPATIASIYFESGWLIALPVLGVLALFAWSAPMWLLGLLFFSIPISFEYSFSASLGTDLPDEPLMVALAMLAIFYLLYRGRPFASSLWHHPLFICFSGWLMWMMIASLVSTTPELSIKFMLAKTWYTGAFFLAPLIWLRTEISIRRSMHLLFVPLFLLALITLIRHAYSGFSFITASEVVQPYFRNHVVYSAMLVTLVPVLYFSRRYTKWKRSWDLALIIVLLALFFSYARGAWLALLVAAFAYLLLKNKMLVYGYVLGLLLTGLTLAWLKYDDRYLDFAPDYRTTIFHSDFSDHWKATYQGKDVSTVERFYRWIAGVQMINERPLTGFGPASFYSSYRPYTVPAYKTWVSNNPDRSTVHNYFLLVAAEQGIPGLLLFLLLLGAILYYAERIYHRHRNEWQGAFAAGIAVIVVMLGVVNFWSDLIETDKIGSLFFLSISLLLILDRYRSVDTSSNIERIA